MRLRSRKREPQLSKRNAKVTKISKKPIKKPLALSPAAWKKIPKKDIKNVLSNPQICVTRSQKLKTCLKTRPVRTKITRSMEKPVEPPKAKPKNERAKKPIFQTVVRSSNKDPVSSSTSIKKVDKTAKPKEVRKIPTRHSSLNRDTKKVEVTSAMNSPRKTRRLDKTDKAASLNSSPIRKVRQIGATSPTKPTVSSTNDSLKKAKETWSEDDITMYEPHTTTADFPTPKSDESDSEANIDSELCLPSDCLNDFIAIPCTVSADEDINFLADKAARVMTTEKDTRSSVDKRLAKRRKSSNDEMYQPTSTTDDLDTNVEADFLANGDKYVQVNFEV